MRISTTHTSSRSTFATPTTACSRVTRSWSLRGPARRCRNRRRRAFLPSAPSDCSASGRHGAGASPPERGHAKNGDGGRGPPFSFCGPQSACRRARTANMAAVAASATPDQNRKATSRRAFLRSVAASHAAINRRSGYGGFTQGCGTSAVRPRRTGQGPSRQGFSSAPFVRMRGDEGGGWRQVERWGRWECLSWALQVECPCFLSFGRG